MQHWIGIGREISGLMYHHDGELKNNWGSEIEILHLKIEIMMHKTTSTSLCFETLMKYVENLMFIWTVTVLQEDTRINAVLDSENRILPELSIAFLE